MKESAAKVPVKLRKKADSGSPVASKRDAPVVADDPLDAPWTVPADATGETVFDDRALRFRSLTVSGADLSVLEASGGFQSGFKIRAATLGGRRHEAGKLVERRYTGRGYTIPALNDDPLLSTFIAYDEGQLVGTVSVRLDSEKGLSADELYHKEIDALRSAGACVCEFTQLAVDKTTASKPVLAGLFHTAYLFASVIRGVTHAVIEVNPRHVAFYGRALRFDPIGEERMNTRVHAPAVLLCAPFAAIAEGIARFAGKPDAPGAGRSLFVYGFPPQDEPGVLRRLRDLFAKS